MIKRKLRSGVNRPGAFRQMVVTQKLAALNQKQLTRNTHSVSNNKSGV